VNGLKLYYEIHGTGQPLILLHGGSGVIETLGQFLPSLTQNRQVMPVELKGYGRAALLDGPLSFEQTASPPRVPIGTSFFDALLPQKNE